MLRREPCAFDIGKRIARERSSDWCSRRAAHVYQPCPGRRKVAGRGSRRRHARRFASGPRDRRPCRTSAPTAADPPHQSGSRFFTPHLLADPSWRLFWWDKFYPQHWSGRIEASLEHAHAVHHWDASWRRRIATQHDKSFVTSCETARMRQAHLGRIHAPVLFVWRRNVPGCFFYPNARIGMTEGPSSSSGSPWNLRGIALSLREPRFNPANCSTSWGESPS